MAYCRIFFHNYNFLYILSCLEYKILRVSIKSRNKIISDYNTVQDETNKCNNYDLIMFTQQFLWYLFSFVFFICLIVRLIQNIFLLIRVAYRLQKPYRGTLLHTVVRTTVYRNSIKLTVIVSLSAEMGIHFIDMPTSHGV